MIKYKVKKKTKKKKKQTKKWDTYRSRYERHLLEATDDVVNGSGDDREVVLSVINHPVKRLVLLLNIEGLRVHSHY